MFEQFSGGYYLGRLYVEPYEGERPAMSRLDHEQVARQLYTPTAERPATAVDPVADGTRPLVMKLGTRHLAVRGRDEVPDRTLAVPFDLVDDGDALPDLREVLLAKAPQAERLIELGAPVGI
ncbi:DUF5802 family protein [Halomarina oriensis]|uniref:Uncharacterized protein n=1 Tax=Halomarina oriensis TaxID=671145 RepID=A0A6B0GKD4_9EURY|nr:DUF5802 family protein [Halomarina oriensis]MWG35080.1 hypothetical protein [Halomarina oriensis]